MAFPALSAAAMDIDDLVWWLDRLDWSRPREAHCAVESLLRRMWADPLRLFGGLKRRIGSMGIPAITKTAELHSWHLCRGSVCDVKLNQFVPYSPTGRASEGIHHHTRPLTSLTLVGGYDQAYYSPARNPDDYREGDFFGAFPGCAGPSTSPGHVYTIDPDIFHALTNFRDGTLTLAVYGPIVRHEITVFNTVTGRVEKRTTCSQARDRMLERLEDLAERNWQL